jgi:hypothetical protein
MELQPVILSKSNNWFITPNYTLQNSKKHLKNLPWTFVSLLGAVKIPYQMAQFFIKFNITDAIIWSKLSFDQAEQLFKKLYINDAQLLKLMC